MVDIRKIFLLIIFCQITVVGYSQLDDYASVYETLKPFHKFTDEYFYKERKQFKIKKMIHKIVLDSIYGYTNLDSLYFHENKIYKELISITSYNFHCPSQEIYTYNENGLLIDLVKYPLSAYLTREDSLVFKKNFTKQLNDFKCVGRFINEYEKTTNVSLIFYNKKDSIIETEKYVYDTKNKKLKELYKNNILKEKHSYSKNKTKIEYYYYDTIDHLNKTFIKENVLKDNNIVRSTTYELGFKDAFYIGYLMKYDAHNNIVECDKNEYGNKYPYFTFENRYTNNILSQIILQPDKNNDKTTFSFYENGLLKSEERKGIIQIYEYEYFD